MTPRREVDDWFVRDVLVLEPALMRFLKRHWREPAELADLRQETYARVYEAATKAIPAHAKAFVFMTARNLMIDRARRGRVVSIETVADFEALSVLGDEPSVEVALSSRQELAALCQAIDSLPPRCRDVVVMRKIEGRPQREVARALGIAEGTVEKQVSKGVRRLAEALYGTGQRFAGHRAPRGSTAKERTR